MLTVPELIADLQRAGLTQVEIADRSGLSQSHISQLSTGARGKRTSIQTGQALFALHQEVCGKPAQQHAAGHSHRGQLR